MIRKPVKIIILLLLLSSKPNCMGNTAKNQQAGSHLSKIILLIMGMCNIVLINFQYLT